MALAALPAQQAEQLEQGALALGLALTDEARRKLLAYVAMLHKWNRTFSLTAVSDPAKAVSHHLLDSLAILPDIFADTVLDVGSGGGQPGIPLAIARPDCPVTLLDSNSKKAAFLRQAVIELDLHNVAVHCGRVEQFSPPANFSVIVSRAFAELADFVHLSEKLLLPEGRWLAMKGVRPDDEIARLPGFASVQSVRRLTVPGVEGERHLIVMNRVDDACRKED